jgi:hypothetical protein
VVGMPGTTEPESLESKCRFGICGHVVPMTAGDGDERP